MCVGLIFWDEETVKDTYIGQFISHGFFENNMRLFYLYGLKLRKFKMSIAGTVGDTEFHSRF